MTQDKHYWANRPRNDKKMDWNRDAKDWVEDYKKSITHPHRQELVRILREMNCDSLLEVGANAGPNLHLFHKEFPEMILMGIDASRVAAFSGSDEDVTIRVGDVAHLPFGSGAFDCVLSDAMLMYVPPEDIRQAMSEIARVAKKYVILVEWHDESVEGVEKDFHWARNYKAHLEYHGFSVAVMPITEAMWPTPKWFTNGRIYVGTK